MKNEEIDDVLKRAAEKPQELNPIVLESIADSIKRSLRPVKPRPPVWLTAVGIVAICAAIALGGAARAGFFGVAKMNPLERLLVFSALGILASLTAVSFVHQMIPGSRVRLSPAALLVLSNGVLLAVFALLFRDYHADHFLSAGITCLLTGLLHAVPAGLLSWLMLRRGFAVNRVSAGIVAGTLSGLAGVGMLELHCANFQAAHIILWHTAVVPVSAVLGAMLGYSLHLRARSDDRLAPNV